MCRVQRRFILPEAVGTVQAPPAKQTLGGPRRGPPGLWAERAWHSAAGGGTAFVLFWRPLRRAVPCMWMRLPGPPFPYPLLPTPAGSLWACGWGWGLLRSEGCRLTRGWGGFWSQTARRASIL